MLTKELPAVENEMFYPNLKVKLRVDKVSIFPN